MTKPYTGGCACGAIRYETSSEPIVENHCQCRDCQKRSGTGHGSYLTFPQRADVTITGEAKNWRVAGDCNQPCFLASPWRPLTPRASRKYPSRRLAPRDIGNRLEHYASDRRFTALR
jgi:hypothetical protein